MPLQAQSVPNFSGSYGGVWKPPESSPSSIALSNVRQDRAGRVSGILAVPGQNASAVQGQAHAGGLNFACDGKWLWSFRGDWRPMIDGAGGLYGVATTVQGGQTTQTAATFFRPFATTTPKPNWLGSYSGFGASGASVEVDVAKGTNGTSTMTIVAAGAAPMTLAADVSSDGTVAGMGVTSNGIIAILIGLYRDGAMRFDVEFLTPDGTRIGTLGICAVWHD